MIELKVNLEAFSLRLSRIIFGLSAASFLIFFISIIAIIPQQALAKELSYHEVFVELGFVPQTKAVIHTKDDAYIIAGTNGSMPEQAWAAKIDKEGAIKWQYSLPAQIYPSQNRSLYYSVAEMSDGSVFLCGEKRGLTPETISPGLLTHLDRDGKLITESLLSPSGETEHSTTRFLNCATTREGLLLVGATRRKIKNTNETSFNSSSTTIETRYWLLFLDSNGKIKRETFIPALLDSPEGEVSIQVLPNKDIVLAVPQTMGTELIRINSKGETLAQRKISEKFLLVKPFGLEVNTQLVSENTSVLEFITSDNKFLESSRAAEKLWSGAVVDVYSMSDQTMILFGSIFENNVYHPCVSIIDLNLHQEQTLKLNGEKEALSSGGAVTRLGSPNQFVYARGGLRWLSKIQTSGSSGEEPYQLGQAMRRDILKWIFDKATGGFLRETGGASKEKERPSQRGLVLDFVEVK